MSNEELAVLAQGGDKAALQELWEQVNKLTAWHCIRYYRRVGLDAFAARGITLEDLKQECYFAFLEAVRAFDSTQGIKFTVYLKFPLQNAFNTLVGLRTVRGRREPLNNCGSLDEPIPGTDDLFVADMVEDPQAASELENAEEEEYRRQLHNALEEAMRLTCNSRQTQVLKGRYYEGKTQTACGKTMGISHSLARQIEQKALRNMRHPKAKHLLDSFRQESVVAAAQRYSTSFGSWKDNGSNPERAVEWVELNQEQEKAARLTYLEDIRKTHGEAAYKLFHDSYSFRGMI